jgi:phospholipid/cholesterol/gamma-HCH transport system substrate-binding protein
MVGAFVLGGVLLFGAGLFMIGDRRLLFAEHLEINTAFGKVSGVEVGTAVRVAGMEAGEVLDIAVPPVPSQKFRVRMRVRRDLSHLVRTDSICAIQTDGIVGSTFIQISPGTDTAPPVAAGGTIPGTDPIELADLIQEGRDTFRVLSKQVVDLTDDVSGAIGALTETTESVNAMVVDANQEIKKIGATGARAIDEVRLTLGEARDIVHAVKGGQGSIGQLLTNDALYQRVTGVAAEAERTMSNLQASTERVRATIEKATARDGAAQQILANLRDTTAVTREVVADLSEGTEALKRNFLIRGFFKDRGFFDLDALSLDAYVGGALARNRIPLRVWVADTGLFTRAADGSEQLSEEGRRRLDSAMAELARYPGESPLVVEGYSDAADGGTAHLVSTDRAALVRDYVVTRFRRKATLTGIMPMGVRAPDSPRGDNRWSGVALALFVRASALTR